MTGLECLKEEMKRRGMNQSQCDSKVAAVVLDKDGVLVIGHGRLLAAKKLGLDSVPCVRADDLIEDQIKALRLVDNKTNESEWDFDILPEELDSIYDFDMQEFGFELNIDFSENQKAEDFFSRENRNDTSKEEGNEEYNDFIEKFEAKKTTDDCYTPEIIYDSICDWVCSEYGCLLYTSPSPRDRG